MRDATNTPLFDVPHPTPQQVFDAVVRHAATMPAPSRGPGGDACLYRTADGNACFVGALLTDAEAKGLDHAEDNTSYSALLASERLPERLVHQDLQSLMTELQYVHDDNKNTGQWRDALQQLAIHRNLDTTVLGEVFPVAA